MQINSLGGADWTHGNGKVSTKRTSSTSFSTVLKESAEGERIEKKQDSYVSKVTESKKYKFTGNYRERLEQIKKQNEETNWDSMGDVEKVRLFEDRYRAAFKDMRIITSALYYLYSPQYTEIYDNYSDEMDKYFDKGGKTHSNSDYCDNYKRAYYGDLTAEETRAAIQKKYEGTGTMEDKFVMLDEYFRCGVNKPGDAAIHSSIEMQIFKKVEDTHGVALWGTGMSISQHPRFLEMFMSYAKGVGEGKSYRPNWTQIVDVAKESICPGKDWTRAIEEKMKSEMDDFLEEMSGRR